MASNGEGHDDPDSLPPSCRYVLHVLDERNGQLTRQELLSITGLPERTLSDALDTLENCGYIHRSRESTDLRQVVAKLADERGFTTPDADSVR